MVKTETILKPWGNSIGIVLSKEELKRENLHINDEVEVIIRRKTHPLKEVFGALKNFKAKSNKSTNELLKEIDKELDSRFD